MATIFAAVASANASANRLNATMAKAFLPQSTLLSQAFASMAKTHQAQFAGLGASLNTTMAKAFLPQSTLLSQALARTYQPLLDAVFALERLNYDSPNIGSASSPGDRLPQRLTDQEIAAMLTVAAFLVVYISFGLLIKHNPYAAKLAATDGPTPFEAAMAVGALVFWLWMHRSRDLTVSSTFNSTLSPSSLQVPVLCRGRSHSRVARSAIRRTRP